MSILCIASAPARRAREHVVRRRHRREDAPHPTARASGPAYRARNALARASRSRCSLSLLGVAVNVLARLLAFTIFLHAVVYTMWLKRATPRTSSSAAWPARWRRRWAGAAAQRNRAAERLADGCDHLFWTPPRFWALSADHRRRTTSRRGADAARGQGRARDAPANPDLQPILVPVPLAPGRSPGWASGTWP